MKKLFMLLLSILVIVIGVIVEGGSLITLFGTTSMFILAFGVLFTTLFTFKLSEIIITFKNAFSKDINPIMITNYKTSLAIIKSITKSTLYWSFTTVFLGLIFILSTLSTPTQLGKGIAIVCLSLLYGFGIIAILFIPMTSSLAMKINSIENK